MSVTMLNEGREVSAGAPPSRRTGYDSPFVANRGHWNKVFTDQEYFDSIAKQKGIAEAAKVSPFGDDYVYRQAMIGYMADTRKVPLEDMRAIYDAEKDSFAKKILGKQTITSRELFDYQKQRFERENEKEQAARKIMDGVIQRSLQDALSGGDTPFVESVAKDIDAASDYFDDEEKSRLWEKAEELDIKVRAAQSKFAPEASFIFNALSQQANSDQGFESPDMQELAGRFSQLPDNQRRAIYELAGSFAQLNQTNKGFWYQMAESLGRGAATFTEAVPRNFKEQSLRGDLRLLTSDQPVFKAGDAYSAAGTTPITPEEREQAKADIQKKLGVFKVERELRDLAERVIDPIKTVTFLPSIVEEGLYGAAQSIPYTAAAAVPYAGIPAVTSALFSSNYDRIMLEYPDVDPDKAALLAAISAPIEAGLERMKVNTIMGRLPVFGGLVKRLQHPNQRNLTRILIGGAGVLAEQNLQEAIQEATFPVVQSLAARPERLLFLNAIANPITAAAAFPLMQMFAEAFKTDVPDFDWGKKIENMPRELAVQFVALLPLSLMGIGALSYREIKRGENYLTNKDNLEKAGFSQEQIDAITGSETGERAQEKLREEWDKRDPKLVKAAAQRIVDEAVALREKANPAALPRLEKQGADYVVLSPEGKELARSTDQTAAEQALVSARRETVQREMRGVTNGINLALEFINKANEARSRGEDIQKFILENRNNDLFQDYEANPTEQNLERLFETVTAFGFDAKEPEDLKNFPVLASNQGALRDGIYRSIVRIFDGADGTIVMRDFAQDNLKRAMAEGRVSIDWVRSKLNELIPQIDSDRIERKLRTETDTDVIEAFSDVAIAYFRGRITEDMIPEGFRGFFRRMAVLMADIFRRSYRLARLRAEGKLDRDFEALLAEAVGVDQQALVDRARERTEQEVGAGQNYSINVKRNIVDVYDNQTARELLKSVPLDSDFYEIARTLSRLNLPQLDTDVVEINRKRDGAARTAYGSRILSPADKMTARTVVHEVVHTLTSDAIDKYVGRETRNGQAYVKHLRKVMADTATPEPIRNLIEVYFATIDRLGLNDDLLGKTIDYVVPAKRRAFGFRRADFASGTQYYLDYDTKDTEPLVEFMRENGVEFGKDAFGEPFLTEQQMQAVVAAAQNAGHRPRFADDFVFLHNFEVAPAKSRRKTTKAFVGTGARKVTKEAMRVGIINPVTGKPLTNGQMYGLANLDEFLAQSLSSQDFQELLNSIPAANDTKSLWDKLVEAVARLINWTGSETMLNSALTALSQVAEMRVLSSTDYFGNTYTRGDAATDATTPNINYSIGKPDKDGIVRESDDQTEAGTLAPDTDLTQLDPDQQQGEDWQDIPWEQTEKNYSIGPAVLPEAYPVLDQDLYEQILAETQTTAAIHIDRMRVGKYEGTDLQGGMYYPAIVANLQKGVVWAFNSKGVATAVAERARANGGYVKLVLMLEGNVIGNKTFANIWFKQLRKNIKAGKITEADALAEMNAIRERYVTQSVKGETKKFTGHDKAWTSLKEAKAAILAMPQIKRGASYFQKTSTVTKRDGEKIAYQSLLSQAMTGKGFPDAAKIVEAIEEPAFKGLPKGTIVGLIKIDKDAVPMTAAEAGVPEHLSYGYVLKGKPVARMAKFQTLDALFPNIAGKLMSQQATDFPARQVLNYSIAAKNSLRVRMTRQAMTDAALAQASWKDWYEEHQAVLDEFFGEYAQLFQDILSITSQAASVKANVGLALRAFGLYVRGEPFDGMLRGEEKRGFLPAVIKNLERHRENDQLQGQKIRAYKASNDGEVDQAVVDRHIAQLIFGVKSPSKAQFAKAQKILTEIANEIGWTPRQVQAALWAHSIYKSGKTPESYGDYLKKLESRGTIEQRIGDLGRRGAGGDANGRGRGRYAPDGAAEGAGVDNYSISTQSEIDRVQKAMDRLARSPSERISQYAALKERLAAALERNQPIMQSMRGDTLPQDFDRTRILNDLGFLDYILKVLPPEVRGRVGGYTNLAGIAPVDVYKGDQKVSEAKNPAGAIISAWMREGLNIGQAQKKTELPEGYSTVANTTDERRDKTVANFLIDRLKKIDRELERYYKRDLMERIFDVLDKSRPKAGDSGVKRSTLGAETQKFADMVYRASLLDDEQTAERLAAIEAAITSTESSQDSQKRISELSEEWTIVNTFGDLKNRPSETMAYGLEWLQGQLKAGREAWNIKETARIEENRQRVADALVILGKPTDKGRFENPTALKRFLQNINALDLDHKSFEQFATIIFGDKLGGYFSEKLRQADISAAKAELENTKKILNALREGAKAAGTSTGKALVKFKREESNVIRKLEGRKVKNTEIAIDLAKKIVRGLADRGSLSKADVETLADELASLPRDTKKQYVTIKQVVYRGDETRISMNRATAMQLWLSWQQSDIQEKMRREGWNDDSAEDLENLLSDPVSQAILKVTRSIYGGGYALTNPVYSRMFGMNMPMVKNYAPARFLNAKEVKDVSLDGSPQTAGGQPSFAKSRVTHSAKIANKDGLTVLQSHIAQQAHWVAFAELTREYRSLLSNPEVRDAITQRYGDDVVRTADMWAEQMEQRGGNKGREIAWINNMLGAAIGGQSVSLLGFNLKSLMMQSDNLMRFALALDSRQIASAMSDPVALMKAIRKVWKTDLLQTRLEAGATAETRFLFSRFVSMFRRGAKISELAMMPMNYVDSAGLSISGAIVYQAAYKDAVESGMTEPMADQAAKDAVEAMIYRYGQPVLMGQKSNIENSGNVFAKTFFLFMSDPRLKTALLADSIRGLATGQGNWKDHVRRIVAVEMMAIVSHVLATAFRDATSDDDDEDLWSMGGFARALLLAPLQGYFLVGSVSEVVLSRLTEARWFTPTQNPFIRTADTAFKAFNNLDDAFNFDDPDALVKEWTNITRSIAVTPPLAAPAVALNLVRPLVQAWERMDDE